jgi:hypothetical protein
LATGRRPTCRARAALWAAQAGSRRRAGAGIRHTSAKPHAADGARARHRRRTAGHQGRRRIGNFGGRIPARAAGVVAGAGGGRRVRGYDHRPNTTRPAVERTTQARFGKGQPVGSTDLERIESRFHAGGALHRAPATTGGGVSVPVWASGDVAYQGADGRRLVISRRNELWRRRSATSSPDEPARHDNAQKTATRVHDRANNIAGPTRALHGIRRQNDPNQADFNSHGRPESRIGDHRKHQTSVGVSI